MNDDTEEIKDALTKPKKKRQAVPPENLLSTGSTLINLACTGRVKGGFAKGLYVFLVGDSSSGKTWLSMTCLAEASINPNFNDYRFIFDNAENGALMDVRKFFGKAVAKRLEPPAGTRESPVNSGTVEEFYFHVDDAFQAGRPFIYILDSMDALTAAEDEEKFQEQKEAHRKEDTTTGSYGVAKAKANSTKLRLVVHRLALTGSILIIISQTRDKLGFGFEKKTRAGGRALKFYAHLELWSSVREKIKKKVKGKDRPVGIVAQIDVKKNRLCGWEGKVEVPIYRSLGMDDIGSCVDYLIEEGHWKNSRGNVSAPEFEFQGTREKLIQHIETNDGELELFNLVGGVWKEIEDASAVKRKARYD